MTIAILGGTGPQGQGLALRFARSGVAVALGSRDAERARAIAEDLNAKLTEAGGSFTPITGTDNVKAAQSAGRMVMLAVPFAAHDATLEEVRAALDGKILVDVVVPLEQGNPRGYGPPRKARPPRQPRSCWARGSRSWVLCTTFPRTR